MLRHVFLLRTGVYELKIIVGQQYPMLPPNMCFVTKVFHPNVHIDVSDETFSLLLRDEVPDSSNVGSVCA